MSRDKIEITALMERIRDHILKKPEKAAIILTNWLRSTPAKTVKSTRKKQAA